ncbi:thioredoxin domain-containing protein 17 isoform X2 [Choloepus didactylus]|uniref:thioredoxin domain-containing protein 17 isoform X2 n=1 Tax=Choloepus didactylus TaxID=27675 RepID=UPI00189FE006|nr:thioredoxin domain-containing protein 17 isoform X2 [Choloepus didactylus]
MELQGTSSEGPEKAEDKDDAEEVWPLEAPVPQSPAGVKHRPCPSRKGLSPPHVEPGTAAADPKDSPRNPQQGPEMAPYEEVRVSGFEEFNRAVEQHNAEPVVREGLKHVSEGCVFIYCQVGERPYWKDPNNDFRKNLKVTAVPTLLKYGTPQKLVESECLQASLVEMLFSED